MERLLDGRTVCINKPGNKGPNDFFVIVYSEATEELWTVKHEELFADLREKLNDNREAGELIIAARQQVHDGEEPSSILATLPDICSGLPGAPADLWLKVYKWIFGQEDVNYEHGEGRGLTMRGILSVRDEAAG